MERLTMAGSRTVGELAADEVWAGQVIDCSWRMQ
jgi:hypothetical protein